MFFFFFFKQKTAYDMRISDWSSDVCSSDLRRAVGQLLPGRSPGRPPLRAQPHRRDERRHPAGDRTQGPGLGRTGHGEPFAPCYSRLLPRGSLPRTAAGSPQRRRRRLSLRLPMKTLIAPLLAAALLFGTVAHAQQVQPLDRIVAVVDEDVILQSELDLALNNVLAQYVGREDQLPPREILQRQVLERLVLVHLQTARAGEMGVRVGDEEIDNAISNIAAQNRLTPDQLRQQLASDGLSYDDFRRSLRDELLTQRLRQRFAQTRISVSEAEVNAALASQTGEQYHLAHILVALPDGATPEQIATGQQKIDGIKGLLDKGEMTFPAAAVRYSDSPNALEGGDLGWRSLDEIPAAFANTIRTLQKGQVIGPIRGPSGFQLLQLVDMRSTDQAAAPTRPPHPPPPPRG